MWDEDIVGCLVVVVAVVVEVGTGNLNVWD